jgi:2,3-bisphosphoglycerate-dependent phosphoglycerate mutase
MSKLILLRHGASIWNKKNIFCGWVDVPLSREGISESQMAGKSLSHLPIDVIFTSGLERAMQTAMIVMAEHEGERVPILIHDRSDPHGEWFSPKTELAESSWVPVYQSERLNERMYGALQGMNKDVARQQFGVEQVHRWRRGYREAPPQGESLADTTARTWPYFQEKIVPWLKKGKNTLICAHGNSLRSIVKHLDHLSDEEITALEIPTGIPLYYDYQDGQFLKSPAP